MVWVGSLAWEIPHAIAVARKKKKKKKRDIKEFGGGRNIMINVQTQDR